MSINLKKMGIDEEKLKEIIQRRGVVHLTLSLERLQEIKDKLIAEDERYQELELRRIQGLLDLMNSMVTGIFEYHRLYGNKVLKKEKNSKPIIPNNNKERHKQNKLRPFATMDEKITWNLNHVANCKCGGNHIPRQIKKEIEKRISNS